jgi:hypothetical protein
MRLNKLKINKRMNDSHMTIGKDASDIYRLSKQSITTNSKDIKLKSIFGKFGNVNLTQS